MHTESIAPWERDHTFGQDVRRPGENRTLIVIIITLAAMAVEIIAGMVFGSMALLADGLHMGSHAAALTVAAFAYFYTRRHAKDARFNFGTGKVNSLAAFTSAIILVLFAMFMTGESVLRLISPVAIGFNQAILVAVFGLIVNGVCLAILGGHGHSHEEPGHDHDDERADHARHHHDEKHGDHNLWSAYLHVLADALTSVLAIIALLCGKHLGWIWLDPVMGVVGAILVARWSWGLLCSSAHVLLDMRAPDELLDGIRSVIESEGDSRISDLHVWGAGPGIYMAEIVVVASNPLCAEEYVRLLPEKFGLLHVTVETRRCPYHEDVSAYQAHL